ncbi:MAG: hypothetical protein L0Z50_05495 [Verrucomicrobiales bacterium]|nr:hypothetical protein [Verrucomicrobiales bacterium]
MNKPEFDPLLNDLLGGSRYSEFRAELKRQALGAFRRARWWRRTRNSGLAMAAVAAVLAILLWRLDTERAAPVVTEQATTPPTLPPTALPSDATSLKTARASVQIETISDEQLLAAFPPDSCFLAELDGQTVLVFSDPAVRDAVMR